MNSKRIWLVGLAVIVLATLGLGYGLFTAKDPPNTFLEDDPEIRAHSSYPARIRDVDHLQGDIAVENDVWIEMRDGTRLSANIFRPKMSGKYPVVMAFTAYDKNKGPDQYPKILREALKPDFDLGSFSVSSWTSWEGPDPAFWVPNGYAVIYVDSRGFASSEGDPGTLSKQDRNDFYDAIEWAGTREWSNGKVGLNGVSYLAISQWVAASGNPPHLKAIIPWEGQSDSFREVLYHGGIPETAFTDFWLRKMRTGANGYPLPPPPVFRFAHKRPELMKWVQQRPANASGIDLPRIDVPALICATWSDQGLHTRGSFEGFKQISTDQKWLFTHGRAKWDLYYSEEGLAFQKDFFDHFLKGADNGFDERKRVRLEVRESLNEYSVRYVDDWPVPGTVYRKQFLDGAANALMLQPSPDVHGTAYDSKAGGAAFTLRFDKDTEITGNMKLKLWVSTDQGTDMDLFVGIEKLDQENKPVTFFAKTGYTKGPVAMGWLRVSQRRLDKNLSTAWQPVLQHGEAMPVSPGEVVPVEVEILPSSTLFRAGESLRLIVQGRDLFDHPSLAHKYSVNQGNHTIHSGGQYDSHLLVPVLPREM
ncbi:MAG: CocE/NonD family hydrolase [Pseudomonadota bacterium]